MTPTSEEFLLNELTEGKQSSPSVAAIGASGAFLTTWSSERTIQDFKRLYIRPLSCVHGFRSTESLIQATDVEASSAGSVLATSPDGVLAVWQENYYIDFTDSRDYSVVAQGFGRTGEPLGDTFRPLAGEAGNEFDEAVTATPGGDFAIAWTDYNVEPGEVEQASRIRWQRVQANGLGVGNITDVAPYSASGLPINPAVAASTDGVVALVWQQLSKDGDGDGIILKRFTASGEALESELVVNSTILNPQEHPAIVAGPNGQFFVVWESEEQDGDGTGIFAQIFDSSGARVGFEFQINQTVVGDQDSPQLTSLPDIGLLVLWESFGQDSDGYGGFARVYTWSGTPLGDEFQLNSVAEGDQRVQRAAADRFGNVLVVWSSLRGGGSRDVVGRFFATNNAVCGDAAMQAGCRTISSLDALAILRGAVASLPCAPCICDVDHSGVVAVTDAMKALQVAVGLVVSLECPPCT